MLPKAETIQANPMIISHLFFYNGKLALFGVAMCPTNRLYSQFLLQPSMTILLCSGLQTISAEDA